jgi:hypothetical protein
MTRRIGLSLALSVIATLFLATIAAAAPQKAVIQLNIAAAARVDDGYVLSVRVRTEDGKPVNEAAVRYYEAVDLIGAREMYLGTTTTDGQGQGSFVYLPAQLGSHQIIARFAGRDQVSSAEAKTAFQALIAAPAYEVEAAPLSSFTQVVAIAVGVIVLSVWALIAFALISTARGVRRGARDLGPKGDLA